MSENIENTNITEPTIETQPNIVQPKKNKGMLGIIVALCILIVGLIALVIVFYCKTQQNKYAAPQQLILDTRATEADQQSNPLANRNITFVGYDTTVLDEDGTILLENLPENGDFLIKFIITDIDTDKVVFETDLIPSGSNVAWTPSENLEKGEHKLSFLQTPFYKAPDGTMMPLTAGNNEVTITIQ